MEEEKETPGTKVTTQDWYSLPPSMAWQLQGPVAPLPQKTLQGLTSASMDPSVTVTGRRVTPQLVAGQCPQGIGSCM